MQATAAGIAIALGGIVRDVVAGTAPKTALGAATGYHFVYAIEVLLLVATLVAIVPLLRRRVGAKPKREAGAGTTGIPALHIETGKS